MEDKKYIGVTEEVLESVVGGGDMNSRMRYHCTKCGFERIYENYMDYAMNRQSGMMAYCVNCGEMGYVRLDTLED
jgi:predicted RNA-binding Zn-ribbon protein involved in translation (DUF1610 family)